MAFQDEVWNEKDCADNGDWYSRNTSETQRADRYTGEGKDDDGGSGGGSGGCGEKWGEGSSEKCICGLIKNWQVKQLAGISMKSWPKSSTTRSSWGERKGRRTTRKAKGSWRTRSAINSMEEGGIRWVTGRIRWVTGGIRSVTGGIRSVTGGTGWESIKGLPHAREKSNKQMRWINEWMNKQIAGHRLIRLQTSANHWQANRSNRSSKLKVQSWWGQTNPKWKIPQLPPTQSIV